MKEKTILQLNMKISTKIKVSALLTAAFLIFTAVNINSQTFDKKLITGINNPGGTVDVYSLRYDAATGGWVYAAYDTAATKYTIITPKGSSKQYNYASVYNALFDADGNSYTTASTTINDSTYRYALLKNNETVAEYDYIAEGWKINNNILYFAATDGGKQYLMQYDLRSGSFAKSKAYDEVRLAYTPDAYMGEGEPIGFVGFTKAGEVYYIAREGESAFLVIGDKEQKHYSDITWYDLKFNSQDEPCYIVKSKGKFYEERGNTFVVQGTKEFPQYDWIYGPLGFDNSGTPMYVGQDSVGEYKYRSSLMKGSEKISTIDGSIYNYSFTPDGKLYYTESIDVPSKNGETNYKNVLVIDGKRSKEFTSIMNPVFGKNNSVMFIASDKNNKYFIVRNNEVVSEKYDYISEAKYLPNGQLAFVAVKYGNYEKNIPDKNWVIIGDEEYGIYNAINVADWKSNQIILTDNSGNYAYLAGYMINKTNYTFKYQVFSNKGESEKFDNISDLMLINGKLVYFAGNIKNQELYTYNFNVYVNGKKTGDAFDYYTDVNVKDGVISFAASKGNEMYYVTVKP